MTAKEKLKELPEDWYLGTYEGEITFFYQDWDEYGINMNARRISKKSSS
jgi:hypothetical protein